jgi:polysaccharide biosynthesis transport protein
MADLPNTRPADPPPRATPPAESHPAEYLQVLHKHRWFAILMLLAVGLPGSLFVFLQRPVYMASGQLLIEGGLPPGTPFVEREASAPRAAFDVETQAQVLRSHDLASRTAAALRLWEHPDFDPRRPSGWRAWLAFGGSTSASEADAPDEAALAAATAGQLLAHLSVQPIELTRLITLWFEASDPQLAARAVNTLTDEFIRFDLESRFASASQVGGWLQTQLEEQRNRVVESEAALQRFKEERNALSVEDRQNIVVQELTDLNAAVTRARTERIGREATYRQLQDLLDRNVPVDGVAAIAGNEFIQRLRGDLASLERERAELGQRFGDKHPEILRVTTAIATTEARLREAVGKAADVVRNEYEAALAQEQSLSRALEQQKGEALRLNRQSLEYGALEREAASNREVYQALLRQAQQLGITSDIKESLIRVVDRAQVPGVPVRPARARNIALTWFVGLVLAVGLVFGREFLDRRVKTPEEVVRHLRMPCLGLLPSVGSGRDVDPLFGSSSAPPNYVEAVRRLRNNVVMAAPPRGPKSLLVTSTAPREGKTIVSVNLAIALAQAGSRVLLIDADLRRPRTHVLLERDGQKGLATFLEGSTPDVRPLIQETRFERLSLLAAGAPTSSANELLSSQRLVGLLETQEPHYDWIIFDSPPIMAVADAAPIARIASGVLFVVAAETTRQDTAQVAVDQLRMAHARFAGAVLNRAPVERQSRYYSRYYHPDYEAYYASPAPSRTTSTS